jgi:hypothetical protein
MMDDEHTKATESILRYVATPSQEKFFIYLYILIHILKQRENEMDQICSFIIMSRYTERGFKAKYIGCPKL